MKKFGIRQYVAWLTLLPLFIMATSLESYFLQSRFADMDQDLLDKGELVAHQLASSSEYGVFSNNMKFLQHVADDALYQTDVRGVLILSADLRVLVKTGDFSGEFRDEIIHDGAAAPLKLTHIGDIDNTIVLQANNRNNQNIWLYHAIVPAQIVLDDLGTKTPPKPTGAVILEISRTRHEGHKSRMLWGTLLATTVFLMLTLYLVHVASRRITDPIRELSEAVQAIGAGKLHTRVSLSTSVDELVTLAQGLNRTTEHLEHEQVILQQSIEEATVALREKKDEAERASHDKSRFLAVASHDLRQPLHALGLYVAELQRKLAGTEQQRLIEQVEQSVDALSTLLNALLDISKLDAGAIVPHMRTCSVDTILKRIAADYQLVANIKNIRLVVKPCVGYVTSDPVLLERVLSNLVSNAIRYTYQHGTVMVACRHRGKFMRIEVRDNGVGISQADQMNIFREFFQLSQPELDTSKGLGLGLAIVDRLVKLMGHRIDIRSAPGKGSLFAVEVRMVLQSEKETLSNEQEKPIPDAEPKSSALSGKRLLIVEDDPAVLTGTAGVMSSWGCETSAAASVAEVVRLMRNGEKWDFIVSDYQLGGKMTGIDVVDLIRKQQNQRVPCILISGDTSPAVLKLVSVSGHHLLHKPVKPAKLRSLIEHLLEEETRQS